MSEGYSSSSTGGVGFCGLLTVVLIALKLGIGSTAVVGWSWWWVLSPLWGGLAVFLAFLLVAGITVCILAALRK